MRKNVDLAERLGLLELPEDLMIDIEDVDKFGDGEVCVLCTGSQGEPLSALALLATGENKWLSLRDSDAVVISAHPIPGNEWAVGKVVDGLHRRGAEVVHTGVEPVHVSGHARQGELKTLLSVARPEWFVPVHGEYRHLVNHAAPGQGNGSRAGQGARLPGRRRSCAPRRRPRDLGRRSGGIPLCRRHRRRRRSRSSERPAGAR